MGFVVPIIAAMGSAAATGAAAVGAGAAAAGTAIASGATAAAGGALSAGSAIAGAAQTAGTAVANGVTALPEVMGDVGANIAGLGQKSGSYLSQMAKDGGSWLADNVSVDGAKKIGGSVMEKTIGINGSEGTQEAVGKITGNLLSGGGGGEKQKIAPVSQAQASYDPGQGKAKYSGGNVPQPLVQQQQAPEQLKTFADFFTDNLQKGV